METRQYYRSLTRNMLLTVILVSLAPLILAMVIIGFRFETSYRDKASFRPGRPFQRPWARNSL